MVGFALALLLSMSAGETPTEPAAPTAAHASAAATTTTASNDGDKVICKNIAVTGTRFPTRECHTKQQWDDMATAARDAVNKATTGGCNGATCH